MTCHYICHTVSYTKTGIENDGICGCDHCVCGADEDMATGEELVVEHESDSENMISEGGPAFEPEIQTGVSIDKTGPEINVGVNIGISIPFAEKKPIC